MSTQVFWVDCPGHFDEAHIHVYTECVADHPKVGRLSRIDTRWQHGGRTLVYEGPATVLKKAKNGRLMVRAELGAR